LRSRRDISLKCKSKSEGLVSNFRRIILCLQRGSINLIYAFKLNFRRSLPYQTELEQQIIHVFISLFYRSYLWKLKFSSKRQCFPHRKLREKKIFLSHISKPVTTIDLINTIESLYIELSITGLQQSTILVSSI